MFRKSGSPALNQIARPVPSVKIKLRDACTLFLRYWYHVNVLSITDEQITADFFLSTKFWRPFSIFKSNQKYDITYNTVKTNLKESADLIRFRDSFGLKKAKIKKNSGLIQWKLDITGMVGPEQKSCYSRSLLHQKSRETRTD